MWSQVFSKAHLWIRFLCRLSLNAPLFLKCFLLCKICVWFCCISLCVHCCVAGKSMHRFTSEGTGSHQKVLSSLGNWRSTVDCSYNIILNVWEISLNFSCSYIYIWHYRVQCSRERYKVYIRFHPDYISKGNVSIIQVVFPLLFISWC